MHIFSHARTHKAGGGGLDVERERELDQVVTYVERERERDEVVHFSRPSFRRLNEPFLGPGKHPAMRHHTPTPMRNHTPTPINANDNRQGGEGRAHAQKKKQCASMRNTHTCNNNNTRTCNNNTRTCKNITRTCNNIIMHTCNNYTRTFNAFAAHCACDAKETRAHAHARLLDTRTCACDAKDTRAHAELCRTLHMQRLGTHTHALQYELEDKEGPARVLRAKTKIIIMSNIIIIE